MVNDFSGNNTLRGCLCLGHTMKHSKSFDTSRLCVWQPLPSPAQI